MKVFHCDHCGQLLFFENTACVNCGQAVAFLPDVNDVGSLEPDGNGTLRLPLPRGAGRAYRLCANYTGMNICNWAVRAEDPEQLCVSCRLTRLIPDVSQPDTHKAWYRLELAKRRLVFTLLELQLPMTRAEGDPAEGLVFEFKADTGGPGEPRVMTGHSDGVITINVDEADDVTREKHRKALHEPYRTLLGHMRHESGHFYWERLVRDTAEVHEYRALFGDERRDYEEALATYYQNGPRADWQGQFVSAYASSHPWEDWAETWAHYLHMIDTLETASACGLSLSPRRPDEPSLRRITGLVIGPNQPFSAFVDNWFSLTYVMNNLNRGLGLTDAYPFVLSRPAIDKLHYVHAVVSRVPR